MQHLEQALRNIGLSDKEARVYLAALSLGASSAQKIAKKAGVNRASTYVMIESLAQRGLISHVKKGERRLFIAEPPSNIEFFLRSEKESIQKKEAVLHSVMKDLLLLSKGSEERPQVAVFEGDAGIEQMRRDIIESGIKDVDEFSPLDLSYRNFPPSDKDHRSYFRQNHDIRLIYSSQRGELLSEKNGRVESKWISAAEFPFDGDITVCGSKVNIIIHTPKILGIVIDHAGIANTFKQLFSVSWKLLSQKKRG